MLMGARLWQNTVPGGEQGWGADQNAETAILKFKGKNMTWIGRWEKQGNLGTDSE